MSRRALLLAGLSVAGCAEVERPTIKTISHESAVDPETEALQKILVRRRSAIQHKDSRAFLADLDQRNHKLIAAQKMLFSNLRQLEFTRFDYMTDQTTHVTDGAQHRFLPVIQVMQLTADAGPGGVAPAESFRYTLVHRDGKYVVTQISGLAGGSGYQGLYPAADAPWNFTHLKIIRADKVWLAGDDSVSDLDRFAAAAKSSLREVQALWGDRISFPGYILFFTRHTASLKKWFSLGVTGDVASRLEGFELPLKGVRKGGDIYSGQYAGSRIVVNLAAAEQWNDDPNLVMRHELTHAVTARAASVSTVSSSLVLSAPLWAIEGFARWVETIGNSNRMAYVRYVVGVAVSAGRFTGKLPGLKDWFGKNFPFHYDIGASVFAYVDRKKGQKAAVEFYARIIKNTETLEKSITTTPVFDKICRDVVGVRGSAFLEQWASFVRRGEL